MKQRVFSASASLSPRRAPGSRSHRSRPRRRRRRSPPRRNPQRPPTPKLRRRKPGTLPSDVADGVARLTSAIEAAEKTIQHLTELEEELGRLRVDVESDPVRLDRRPPRRCVRSSPPSNRRSRSSGRRPPRTRPPEAPAIAAERARLTALAAALDGAIKSTELTWVRARQLIEKITVLRHSLFTKNLMERLPSPLLPGLWRDLMSESPAVGHRIGYLAEDWLQWADAKRMPARRCCLLAALVLFVGLRYAIGRLTDRRRMRTEPPPPSFFERARSVAWVAPLRALPAIAAGVLLYGGLDALGPAVSALGRAPPAPS